MGGRGTAYFQNDGRIYTPAHHYVGKAATLIVAASNSMSKELADYVCDGIADNVEIQAAIDALPAGGGKVLLLEGNFSLTTSIDPCSGLELRGQGPATVLTWDGADGGAIIADSGAPDDIRITDMKFDMNAKGFIQINGGGSRIRIDHLNVTGGKLNQATIYVGSCDQVEIDHNIIDGTNGDLAISGFTCDDVNIHDNIGVNGLAQSFISIGSSSDTVCYRNLVSNNIANGWGTGLDIYGNIDDVIVSGGYFEGSVNDGIEVHLGGATYYPKRVSIIGTQVKNCGRYGLHAEMHATEGVLLVDGFRSYNSTNSGIRVETSGKMLKVSDTIVNVTGGATPGIEIYIIDFVELESVTVMNAGGTGIFLASTVTFAKILNTFAYSCGNNGIRTDVPGTVIVGGEIIDNGDNGIDIHGVDHCIVEGVRITDTRAPGSKTQDYGIGDFSGASYSTFKGNNTIGNRLGGINIAGSSNAFDQIPRSTALSLIGGATDVEVFHATRPCYLVGYTVLYNVATGAGAGVNIRVGRYQDGVALDDDHFDVSVSEINKAKGYAKHFITTDLTNKIIATGDTVTAGTAGGKADTGEVIVILEIAEMAD